MLKIKIYKTIILPVALYKSETLNITLVEENTKAKNKFTKKYVNLKWKR
jgi:hypothetical protein